MSKSESAESGSSGAGQTVTGSHWKGPSGQAYVARLVPDGLLVVMQGRVEAPAGDLLYESLSRELARQAAKTYWDLWDLVYYHSHVRARCTAVLMEGVRSGRVSEIHATTQSKIVLMGVSVANLAVGGRIRTHADRRTFDAAIRPANS